MSAEGASNAVPDEPSAVKRPDPHRALRRTWRLGASALVGLYGTTLLSPRLGQPLVVVVGIDSYGWAYLLGVATAVLTGFFIGGFVYVHTRRRNSWWSNTLSALTLLLLSLAALVGLPVALLAGLLSFKNSYREVGMVDGRAIVVQQFAGWDADDELDAGYRAGPFVTFQATGDSFLDRPPAAISTWHFSTTTTPSTVQIHYRAGQHAHQAGTLTLPRTVP